MAQHLQQSRNCGVEELGDEAVGRDENGPRNAKHPRDSQQDDNVRPRKKVKQGERTNEPGLRGW